MKLVCFYQEVGRFFRHDETETKKETPKRKPKKEPPKRKPKRSTQEVNQNQKINKTVKRVGNEILKPRSRVGTIVDHTDGALAPGGVAVVPPCCLSIAAMTRTYRNRSHGNEFEGEAYGRWLGDRARALPTDPHLGADVGVHNQRGDGSCDCSQCKRL